LILLIALANRKVTEAAFAAAESNVSAKGAVMLTWINGGHEGPGPRAAMPGKVRLAAAAMVAPWSYSSCLTIQYGST
jgi:hypothetical protein